MRLSTIIILGFSVVMPLVSFARPTLAQPTAVMAQQPMQQLAQQLNLTAAQRSELQQIVANTFDAMQGILTPEQQQTLGNGISNGQNFSTMRQNLNLSDAQRQQMRSIVRSSVQQARGFLTPDQQQQLRNIVRTRLMSSDRPGRSFR
jgi:Spy/CpxP family protein refolding chaperone